MDISGKGDFKKWTNATRNFWTSNCDDLTRSDGVMILAILAVFFAGMALGGFLFAYKSEPMQIASNDATPAIPFPNGAPPTTRH